MDVEALPRSFLTQRARVTEAAQSSKRDERDDECVEVIDANPHHNNVVM